MTRTLTLKPEQVCRCIPSPRSRPRACRRSCSGGLSTRPTRRARAYARAFPRSQKIVFADAPHPCYLKAPSYFNRLLLQFAGASSSGAGSVEEGAPAPSEVRVVAQWTAAEAAAEL